MASIEVESREESEFHVRILEGKTETRHVVFVAERDYQRLTGGRIGAEELVRRSFEFLLEREPKESILNRFDLLSIGRYFPEYEAILKLGM